MKKENCKCLISDCASFRMYYKYDEQLNGYLIMDLPSQISNSVVWVSELKDALSQLLEDMPLYFLSNDCSWIKNHSRLHMVLNGVIIYEYINHFKEKV